MALNSGMRSGFKLLTSSDSVLSKSDCRGFHSTDVKRMGGHGHDEPTYVHAKHMYNLEKMTHQRVKVTAAVGSVVGIGVGVPIYATRFMQRKTDSA